MSSDLRVYFISGLRAPSANSTMNRCCDTSAEIRGRDPSAEVRGCNPSTSEIRGRDPSEVRGRAPGHSVTSTPQSVHDSTQQFAVSK